jgi:hypothetical protein
MRDFGQATGGKGADVVNLTFGGEFTFKPGDGGDRLTIGQPNVLANPQNAGKINKITFDGYAYADLAMTMTISSLRFVSNTTASDTLDVSRIDPTARIDIEFIKNGQKQVLEINGGTTTLGPLVPV